MSRHVFKDLDICSCMISESSNRASTHISQRCMFSVCDIVLRQRERIESNRYYNPRKLIRIISVHSFVDLCLMDSSSNDYWRHSVIKRRAFHSSIHPHRRILRYVLWYRSLDESIRIISPASVISLKLDTVVDHGHVSSILLSSARQWFCLYSRCSRSWLDL